MRMPRSILALCCAAALAPFAFAAAAHALTSATWLAAGTGNWSDPTKWDSNPLHPCNGNGGESFDAAIPNGTVTLDLDCAVEAFTFSGGTLGGDFDLTANQPLTWSAGELAGNGTTQAAGGAAFSGNGTKSFGGTRTLDLSGGAATWSAGSISLGSGGATLRSQVAFTVTGATGRSLNDTGNTGSFLNEAPFTLALSSASSVLTLAPGTFTQSSAVHVNTGVLVLSPTTGSYTGSFDGAGSLRFGGGAQALASGASLTVADAEVTGGTLTVSPGASFAAGNLDLQVGTFSVADAGTTATAGTATQLSGTLTGAGSFETSGLLTWSGGSMSGSGTTRANGGLALSGSATKLFDGTRTLRIAGGSGSWSAGSISLGDGGATLRNEVDFTATGATGRSLNDTGNTGSFLNEGVFTLALTSGTNVLTLAPGTLTQSGAVHVDTGVLVLSPTTGSYTGSFDGAGSLRFGGGAQTLASGASLTVADAEVTGGTLSVQPGATFAAGNLDLQVGAFSVADAATTATAGTATQLSGTLTGAGSFETSGLLTWSGGSMSGSGTTRANGGLALSTTATKLFAGTRTLRIAGGSATWSAGNISLGSGGATLRNQVALTATGPSRSLSDTSDTGSFLNEGTFTLALDSPASQLTVSPGTISNGGTLDLVTGTLHMQGSFTQTAGVTRLSGGTLTTPISTDLDIQGGAVEGSGLIQSDVQCACAIAPGFSAGQLEVDGDLSLLPGAELRAEIAGLTQGVSYDFVPASGSAALAGTLTVSFLAGFENTIAPGDSLTILEAGAPLTGSFSNVASGERVITTPGLDSIAVRYGAGSPTGAQRVVLHDFRAFAPAAVFQVGGAPQGGSITLTLAGVAIVVTTSAGQPPEEVAAAIADAINANGPLARQGIAGIATGDILETNAGLQTDPLVTDPGITITFVQNVPALPALALALLALLLGGLGVRYARSPA